MFSIQSIMTEDVITVAPDTPIFDAMQLLKNYRFSGLPVVDEDKKIHGILTEKDVLRILMDDKLEFQNTVADYMSRDVVTFSKNDSAIKLCEFFIKKPIRRVPIVEDGKLIGIVSRHDLIPLILEIKSKFSQTRYD